MATTKDTIHRWIKRGIEENATHMIVVCDTFDHTDYPVYVYSSQLTKEKIEYIQNASMQRVMEVYNLSMDIEAQLNQFRAWNL